MNVLLKKKKLEPPVHHLVQIQQFHGLTNGLVVLDHLVKRGRERSSPNLEQSTDWRRKWIGSGDIRNGGGANKMRRRRVEVTKKWIRMGIQKRPSGAHGEARQRKGSKGNDKSEGAMQCVASGDVKICRNAEMRKVPNGKAKIWVKANWDVFANNFEVATAVLSRLKGPVAGQYTQVRLQECYTAGVWPTWDNLKIEIKKYFKPQAERDWSCQQICTFKQGNMRTDDSVTQFLALLIQGGLGNEHAVDLLERNVNPHIAEQLYLQDMRSNNLSQAAEEVQKIGDSGQTFVQQDLGLLL
ncbi:hypothetical protein SERLA73DRAFT_160279 [Serpula lacrymans var. lacrymans S7.3]|uniref:Retrotransposon gag domain-containing protein n=1 Tax=Serpula lacrymans var. lacrymans (strain S7.3) TaxID=936435 RepID=F8PU80_SERL3|nr:hypothetical protein SERLA73DRAFT_160279 [Serpula lacrymans var. lacrymans S7.3]